MSKKKMGKNKMPLKNLKNNKSQSNSKKRINLPLKNQYKNQRSNDF